MSHVSASRENPHKYFIRGHTYFLNEMRLVVYWKILHHGFVEDVGSLDRSYWTGDGEMIWVLLREAQI